MTPIHEPTYINKVSPTCLSLVPGFPGCLEDEEYPYTWVKSALYQDPLVTKKWNQQPDTREYPADEHVQYHTNTDQFSREHWDNYNGFLCPSKVTLFYCASLHTMIEI